MAITGALGIVVSLPSEDTPGVIGLEEGGTIVHFSDDTVSTEFTRKDTEPFEVGTLVKLWAVKVPIHPEFIATEIQTTVEPLTGPALLMAMITGDTSLPCIKGMLDPGSNANREQMDRQLEESWTGYTTDEDEPPFGAGPIRLYPRL